MNKPTDSVRIVIFNKQDKTLFLVLSEKDDPTNLKLPGGKFKGEDETPYQAAARELTEELGVISGLSEMVSAGVLVNDDGFSKRYIFYMNLDEDAVKPTEEVSAIKWLTTSSIPQGKNKGHILSAVNLCQLNRHL